MRYWQDHAKTIPAVADGDPVMVMETGCGPDLVAPRLLNAPTLVNGRPRLDGVDDCMIAVVSRRLTDAECAVLEAVIRSRFCDEADQPHIVEG
jgi:hypothetical protein